MLMNVAKHYFLDSKETLCFASDYLKEGKIKMEISPGVRERVDSTTSQLSCQLERKLLIPPKRSTTIFVWAAC